MNKILPATSLSYSSRSLLLSSDLSLWISSSNTVIEFWHLSKSFLFILTLMESMQVLSILCASSKTTTEFLKKYQIKHCDKWVLFATAPIFPANGHYSNEMLTFPMGFWYGTILFFKSNNWHFKVNVPTFWEGHKILRNLHNRFDCHYKRQT